MPLVCDKLKSVAYATAYRIMNISGILFSGDNGTIDGQGQVWWDKFHKKELTYTRPYLIEIMFSENIQISNLTLIDSPSWNIHPIYSRLNCQSSLKKWKIITSVFSLSLLIIMFISKVRIPKITISLFCMCSNIIIQGITILAPVRSPNTDGINPGKLLAHPYYVPLHLVFIRFYIVNF